jgi:flagellar hook-length control protein FliK
MLKVNPANTKNSFNDLGGVGAMQRSMVANAASNSSLHSDPAGFASLLKQTQTQAKAPAPQPAAKAPAPPAQQATKAPAPADDSSPAKAPSNDATGESATASAQPSEATDVANSTTRGKTLQKARQTNDDNTTAAQRAAKHATTKSADGNAGTDPAPAANDAQKDATNQANAADTPIDPTIMQWLAGQQRAVPTSTDARAAKADADSKAAHQGDDAAATDSLGAAAGKSAKADLRADARDSAAANDKASQGKTLGDAISAGGSFAAMLAEKRATDLHDGPSNAIGEVKDATAAANAASFAPEHSATAAAADAAVTVAVHTPVDSPEFPKALGLHMSMLAKDGVSHAELHLNPADMGPVSVQIVMDGTQARVDFGADMAATRHAIEAGLPELASALRDAGFTLAGGGVSDSSRGPADGRNSSDGDARSGGRQLRPVDPATTAKVSAAARRVATRGGVDLFV